MIRKPRALLGPLIILTGFAIAFSAQRQGGLDPAKLGPSLLVSNGPAGPIRGGESAVTDMVLMPDGWVYGGTEASWGGRACHLFKTDGRSMGHVLDVTSRLPGQTRISDLAPGAGGLLFGATSCADDVFDRGLAYEGGHIFSYDPATAAFVDRGVLSEGRGIRCIEVDQERERLYAVTYPDGHLRSFSIRTGERADFGEIQKAWRVKDLGRVSWRGVPRVLMLDDAGTVYFAAYAGAAGGRIFRLAPDAKTPVFTGATVPTQAGMSSDPLYENTVPAAIRARDGGFWCGSSVDGFLFKFHPSTSTVINKGKAFNYWNIRSLAYGRDGKLYLLGGRDYDNSWLLCYDPAAGSLDCLGWPTNTAQCAVICADRDGRILMAENLRNSYIYIYEGSR